MAAAGSLRSWVDGSYADGTFPQRLVTFVVGVAVIAGLIALDTFVFREAFDSEYWRWYLRNGALIGITFGLVTLAWGDLNRMTSLISAHPHDYASTCFRLGVLPQLGGAALIETYGTWRLRRQKERSTFERLVPRLEELADDPELSEEERQAVKAIAEKARGSLEELAAEEPAQAAAADADVIPRGLGPLDVLLGVLFAFAFLLVFAGWLIVVAPLQYVVNLAAGAPARRALASPMRAWYRITPRKITVGEDEKKVSLPEEATEAKFSTSPVTFTSAVASALLFVVSTLALN